MSKLQLNVFKFKHHDVTCFSLYKYDENMKEFIYQLKGCYDIELGEIFLNSIIKELRLFFKGYTIVPIPSNECDDEIREFNHVEQIFSYLKLPMLKILYKKEKYKQSDQKKTDRSNIKNILKLSTLSNLKNQKILIVDDIFTTGSTLGVAIDLIKQLKPKDIKCLVVAKVEH